MGLDPIELAEGGEARQSIYVKDARHAVQLFQEYAMLRSRKDPSWLEPLRGKDLCCWCKMDQPCHADVLLELANPRT